MTAMLLANAFIAKGIAIEVLESPTVGIIGVGEGSTVVLREGDRIEMGEVIFRYHVK